MPDHAIPPALPPKLPAAKTQVEPFELRVDKRGEIRNRTFSAKVQWYSVIMDSHTLLMTCFRYMYIARLHDALKQCTICRTIIIISRPLIWQQKIHVSHTSVAAISWLFHVFLQW